jgi:hypothetical protein
MQLSGCWLDVLRDLHFVSALPVGSMLTLRGLPRVTNADAIARPATKNENASTSMLPK